MFQNNYGEHDAELVRIAMHYASGLVGNYGYTPSDADDILQILVLAANAALPRFNPTKAKRSTFICEVLAREVADLIRHVTREMRDKHCEELSLDDLCPREEDEEILWSEVIGVEKTLTENGCSRNELADFHSLRVDLEEALAELPPRLRELCELHASLSHGEARRAAGMAYSTHHRAIKRIREFLTRRGFAEKFRKKSGRIRGTASNHSIGEP